jgi:deoxyribose-phosphate aldolase
LIIAGADFIKTSTGKVPVNATPEAAAAMLLALKNTNPLIGFKAAGGIRTVEQAFIYYYLAKKIMGDAWLMPDRFRIGASSLLDVILSKA